MAKKTNEEYWLCTIGPMSRAKQPWGADAPLRAAVKSAFFGMFPKAAGIQCSSGWGVTQEQRDAISFAADSDELKKVVIASMHDEKKPLPRYMRAWELLFAQEAAKTRAARQCSVLQKRARK